MRKKKINLAVLGLGQIGASIAAALKKRPSQYKIYGFDRCEKTLRLAKKKQWIDSVFNLEKDLASSLIPIDMLILCLPVQANIEMLTFLKEKISKPILHDLLIVDVGSSKLEICKKAKSLGLKNFIASHPMAGKEKPGIHSACENLFQNNYWFVTQKLDKVDPLFLDLLKKLSAKPVYMTALQHDRLMAQLSHLPHVIAFAFLSFILKSPAASLLNYAGGSFKDLVRITQSAPEMVTEMLLSNSENLLAVIDSFMDTLEKLKSIIKSKNKNKLLKFLTQVKFLTQARL